MSVSKREYGQEIHRHVPWLQGVSLAPDLHRIKVKVRGYKQTEDFDGMFFADVFT